MKKVYIITALLILALATVLIFTIANRTPTFEALRTQINGGKCEFEFSNNTAVKRGVFAGMSRRGDSERCIIDAAKLLALMFDTNPDTVPVLIEALRNNFNVDSGDGIIPVRSEIALALGRIGDKRALGPLQEILTSEDPAILSKTAGVQSGYVVKKGTSFDAVQAAILEITSK